MKPINKVALYHRVSSTDQVKKDTIENQKIFLPPWCKEQGWEMVREYEDPGQTGKKMENRPQFLEMLDAVKAGEFDAIVVRHHDRITSTESLREWGIIYGYSQESGTLVPSPYDGIADLDSLEDQVKLFIMGHFSAKENQEHRGRQAEGRLKKARKGQSIGGKCPPARYWDGNDQRSAQLHERDKKGG